MPLIHLFPYGILVIDAARPYAARISKNASTTRRGIRCRETMAIEMITIVSGSPGRVPGIDSS